MMMSQKTDLQVKEPCSSDCTVIFIETKTSLEPGVEILNMSILVRSSCCSDSRTQQMHCLIIRDWVKTIK